MQVDRRPQTYDRFSPVGTEKSSSLEEMLKQISTLQNSLKRAEEANGRLAATLDLVPSAAAVLDSKARLLYINAAGRDVLGYLSDDKLIGRQFPNTYAPWSRDLLIKEALPKAARSGYWSGKLAVVDIKTGQEVHIFQQIRSQRRPDGSLFFSFTFEREQQQHFTTPTNNTCTSQQPSSDVEEEEEEEDSIGSSSRRTSVVASSKKDATSPSAFAGLVALQNPVTHSNRGSTNVKQIRNAGKGRNTNSFNVEDKMVQDDSSSDGSEEPGFDGLRTQSSSVKSASRRSAVQLMKPENLLLATRDVVLKASSKKQEEELLLTSLQGTTFGMCIAKQNGSSWNIESSNNGFQRMTGYSASELRGIAFFSLWAPESLNHTPQCLFQGALADQRECAVEMIISCKDQSLARCRVSSSPLPHMGRQGAGRVLLFFTKFQETGDSPGSSASHILSFTDDEAVFGKIFESLDVGMLVWSRETVGDKSRFRLLAINNKCDSFGVVEKAKARVGKYFDELNPELVDSGLLTTYDAILNSGQPRHIGLVPLQHKEYKPCLFNVTGFPISNTLLGIIFDQVDGSATMKPGIPYYPTSHQRFGQTPASPPAPSTVNSGPMESLALPPLKEEVPESDALDSKYISGSRKRMRSESPTPEKTSSLSLPSLTLPPLDRAHMPVSAALPADLRAHRDAFECHPLACAILSANGRVVQANNSLCQLLGYRKDELEGLSFSAVLPADDARNAAAALAQLLTSTTQPNARFNIRTYVHKQGHTASCIETTWLVGITNKMSRPSSPIHVDPTSTPVPPVEPQIMLMIQPVAGIKERFPLLFSAGSDRASIFLKSFAASPIAVGVFGREGKLQELNPALCALLGHPYPSPAALEGRGFESFIHADDLDTVLGLPCKMVSGGLPSTQVIVRCKHRDGATIFCLMYLSLVSDDLTGATTHLVAHIQSMAALEQLFRMV